MDNSGCIVLLSGGLDSTVMLAGCLADFGNDKVFPLYVNYGSKHKEYEYAAAKRSCDKAGIPLMTVDVSKGIFSNAALTNPNTEVPSDLANTIDVVVPFRNLSLATFGAMYADMQGVDNIFMSPTKEDEGVFRDCRREFFDQVESVLKIGAKYEKNYFLRTPHIFMSKAEVIQKGINLGVDFADTWSCYSPKNDLPCGICPACQVRAKGFKELGVLDTVRIARTINSEDVNREVSNV